MYRCHGNWQTQQLADRYDNRIPDTLYHRYVNIGATYKYNITEPAWVVYRLTRHGVAPWLPTGAGTPGIFNISVP